MTGHAALTGYCKCSFLWGIKMLEYEGYHIIPSDGERRGGNESLWKRFIGVVSDEK